MYFLREQRRNCKSLPHFPQFVKLIHSQVMLAERSVDRSSGTNDDDDDRFTWSNDMSVAEEFLQNHKSAKIVVTIDTHSADNGYFIWTGTSAETYRACLLLEVTTFIKVSIRSLTSIYRYSGIVAQREYSSTCLMPRTLQSTVTSLLS